MSAYALEGHRHAPEVDQEFAALGYVRYIQASQKFVCPCHGGVYGFEGQVEGGPPVRPLDRFYTRVERRPRPGRRPLLAQLRAASASRRATRRTTSTGSGSTSTRRGRPHEVTPPLPRPCARSPKRPGQDRNGAERRQRRAAAAPTAQGPRGRGRGLGGRLARRAHRREPVPARLPLPQGAEGHELVLHARLGHDVRLPLAGDHRRVPGHVLRAGPDARLRVGLAHHQRGLPRRVRARHAQVGLVGDDHPDLPAHGQDVLLRRLQVPARAELGHRRDAAGADADDGPHRLPAAVRPALLLGDGGGREHQRLRPDRRAPTWPTSCAAAPSSGRPRSAASTRCTCSPSPA